MHQVAPTVEEVFLAALEFEEPEARSAYLAEACPDADFHRQVERLLALDAGASGFLESPASLSAGPDEASWMAEGPGSVVGAYTLIEPIGEGGMGVVYLAEQSRPVRRPVALKLIKPGMDTKQVIARFEAERQALAMMDHPHIAKVHDGGTSGSGRPYFVMELVRGEPITEHCDAARLTIRERLELFVLVCRAVQHAHQKGIIHRDLKPSNILVASHDGVPVPKVIDFGIAKAIGRGLAGMAVVTTSAQLIGTPLSMSPEQVGMSGLDVDTRSDVYSLGVLMYELLTGTTPFDSAMLKEAGFDEVRRIIREVEPPRPSGRFSSIGETGSRISACRGADPRKLGPLLHGELDWIVMKALEKDRQRRYGTVGEFAADVMRYLTDQPVEARPPSRWYRFTKFARRNRLTLALAIVAGMTLALAVVGLAIGALLIDRERDEALRQRAIAVRAVEEMYEDVASEWLSTQEELRPVHRRFLEKALAYYEGFAREAGRSAEERYGAAVALDRAGWIQQRLGHHDQAAASLRRGVAIMESVLAASPEALDDRLLLRRLLGDLGKVLHEAGRHAESIEAHDRALAIAEDLARRVPGEKLYQEGLADSYSDLAAVLLNAGRPKDSEAAFRRSLRIREAMATRADADPALRGHVGAALHNLGVVLADRGEYEEAAGLYERAIGHQRAALAADPGNTPYREYLRNHYQALGEALIPLDRLSEAEEPVRQAIALAEALVADYPNVPGFREPLGSNFLTMGTLQSRLGRLDAAEVHLVRAASLLEALAQEQPSTPDTRSRLSRCLITLGDVLVRAGRTVDAEDAFRRALVLQEQLVEESPDFPVVQRQVVETFGHVGGLLLSRGELAAAEKDFRRALEVAADLAARYPTASHQNYLAIASRNLSNCLTADPSGVEEAVELARRAVEIEPGNADFLGVLGIAAYRFGDYPAAFEALDQSLGLRPSTDELLVMAMTLWRIGRRPEARRYFEEATVRIEEAGPDANVLRLREEAAGLLGIGAEPETPSEEARASLAGR